MFREMRRKKQMLPPAETEQILKSHTSGVLGVSGDDGYPYTVPLSYTYHEGRLFFHCAREGHKLDGIRRNEKVSFCIIDQDEVIPAKFATHYRSVIAFGRARILETDAERRAALESLVEKYSPAFHAEGQAEIERDWERVVLVEMCIEHLTGKSARVQE